jgi:hypothetical protein
MKSTWLSLLVCLNLLLLTGLFLISAPPATAYAQATGLAGNYMMVSAQVQSNYDALYVVDMRRRTMHVFLIDRGTKQLEYADYRELERDFRNNARDNR